MFRLRNFWPAALAFAFVIGHAACGADGPLGASASTLETNESATVTTDPAMAPGRSWNGVSSAMTVKPTAAPPGADHEIAALRLATGVTLPPLDHQALLAEDELTQQEDNASRRLRAGVPRDVLLDESAGVWELVPDVGYVWSTAIVSSGAFGVRLHFSDVHLPVGARLWVYAPEDDASRWWSTQQDGPSTRGDFWTPEALGDRVVIEVVIPHGTIGDDQVPELGFVIDGLQHLYRDLRVVADGLRDISCMADSACWSPWDTIRNAVALMSFIDGGAFICSGQLIDTQAGDFTPYFLTASHCIDSQSVAETASFNFFYQKSTCGGVTDNGILASDADLVSTLTIADGTLLMIKGVLDYNRAPTMHWAGWTTAFPPNGAEVVGIHHPEGTWNRISFGTKQTTGIVNIGGIGQVRVHTVQWHAPPSPGGPISVLEGGSSGSAMYMDSTQLIVGQLSGGSSTCSSPLFHDSYGRFDWAYGNAPGWATALQIGPDDGFEDNDACASAAVVGDGMHSNLVVKHIDEDWYAIPLQYDETLDCGIGFVDQHGDVDVELYDACGGNLVASSTTHFDSESIFYTNTDFPGTFYLRVFLSDDTRNTYNLNIDRIRQDCNSNGNADSCDLDCGAPGTPCFGLPDCGSSFDCNSNEIPDACETDCNNDGLADECAITGHPSNELEVCPGDTAMFSASASDPGFGYQWIGPGGPLSDGGRVSGATTDTLTITDVELGDAGQYSCQILDGCVLAESDPASLTVAQLATITTQPTPVVATCVGNSVVFSIGVSGGSATPQYLWHEDGVPLSDGGRYSGVLTSSLQIASVGYADEGVEYTCVISNACDSALSNAGTIQINDPVFLTNPRNACGEIGDTVTLKSHAVTPAASIIYQWRKEGGGSVGSGDTLTLSNLQASDAGEYYALAFTLSPTCITESERATVTVATNSVCWLPDPGDMDGDGDYDLADMDRFMRCFSADTTTDFCCSCANVDDSDSTVDADDWTALEALIGGPL